MVLVCFLGIIQVVGMQQVANASDSLFDCIEDEKKCVDDPNKQSPAEKNDGEKQRTSVGTTAWDYIKTFFAFIFVVGLLLFLLKWLNKKNRGVQKNRVMQNLGGLSLGQQKSVQLVLIGKTYYILGVGDDVQLLKEVVDADELAQLLQMVEEEEQSPIVSPIEKYWKGVATRLKGQKKSEEQEEQSFAKLFHHQLDGLKEERQKQLERLVKKEQRKND